jgi:hypothetical protein
MRHADTRHSREWMSGERVFRTSELARRVLGFTSPEPEERELHAVPRHGLPVARRRRFDSHLHELGRLFEIALELARVRRSSVGCGGRPDGVHPIDRIEAFSVRAELEVGIADDAENPVIIRPTGQASVRLLKRFAEAVLGEIHRREHPLGFVPIGIERESAHQRLFGPHGMGRISRESRLPEERVGEGYGSRAV